MFNSHHYRINKRALGIKFGAKAEGTRIHQVVYPNVDPPRRPYSKGIYALDHETTTHIYIPPFGVESKRHPLDLTHLAYVLLDAL